MSKVSNDNKMVNKKYSEIISKDILYDNANTVAENLLWEANKKEDKEDKSKLEDNNIKLEGNSAIAENIKKRILINL
ncbi:Eukaryotic translation initiation factor 5 [Clostridium neonatale]|nr:Eukaryotic translation initiation factor 5 [Clostridium neonatale]